MAFQHSNPPISTWEQIADDLASGHVNDYETAVDQNGKKVVIHIAMSPGGANEGGYESTVIIADIPDPGKFRFSIFPQDILLEISKFFGAEDKEIGDKDFDKNTMIKTNDVERTKRMLADPETRRVFKSLSGYSLSIKRNNVTKTHVLEFDLQHALINIYELETVYNAFANVLEAM